MHQPSEKDGDVLYFDALEDGVMLFVLIGRAMVSKQTKSIRSDNPGLSEQIDLLGGCGRPGMRKG